MDGGHFAKCNYRKSIIECDFGLELDAFVSLDFFFSIDLWPPDAAV